MLRGFRLLDDDFFTKCFKGDTANVELVLQIVLDMYYGALADRVRFFKKRMLADGILTLEKIAEYARLPFDEVKKLKEERNI